MKGTKWQTSFFALFIVLLSLLAVSASSIQDAEFEKRATRSITSTTRPQRRYTTRINNCRSYSIQRSLSLHSTTTTTKPSRTRTVYVCRKTSTVKTTKKNSMRKTTRKTSKKTSKVFSRKPVTKSTSKKVSTKKITPIKKTTVPKVNPSKNTSKKISRKTSKKINNTKKSTSKKSTVKKTTTTTTRKRSTTKRTTTKRKSPATTTTTTEHLFVFVPVALPTNNPIDEWEEPVINIIEYTSTTDEIIPTPSPSITDHNDPVTVQNVAQGKDVDAEPQSKVVGVSIGAVVGCLAAAGLAGMFIYKRHQRNVHDKDVEDLNETSEVNTRWRTQSFMAVVAGAVSKLPNRSNSSSSQRSIGIGVMGSLRRAATNASRSLSRSGSSATQQSYGIATSAPAPPIARIDVDDYYSSNNTPHNQHNHVY